MEFNERIYDLIDRYLNGELQGQELREFEQQIESIPQLKDEIRIQEELLAHFNDEPLAVEESDVELEAFLGSKEAMDMQSKLKGALSKHNEKAKTQKEKSSSQPDGKVKRFNWKPLAVAATVLLLVGFFYVTNMNGGMSSDELFAEYHKVEPLALVTKGSTDDIMAEIEKQFNAKSYDEAAVLMGNVLDTMPETHNNWFDLKLSKGIADMEMNDITSAQSVFDELRKGDYLNAPKADWYYILSLLKQGDGDNARKEIEQYLEKGGRYKKNELEAILNQL